MKTRPEMCLQAIAPYREELVVCVECLCTWYGLADLCAREGRPFVLGHARAMQAIHGGPAKNDTIDAQQIAGLLRGGLLPQAYGSPAAMRATRDLRWRRTHVRRKRAELLTHIQQTTRQYTLPASGKKIAYTAHRDGVAARLPAPAVQQSIAVDLALIGHDAPLRRDVELSILQTAKPPNAQTLDLLRTLPGMGESLSVVLLSASHDITRFPRVQDGLSYCRRVKGPTESAGKR